jgi:transposase-like protein
VEAVAGDRDLMKALMKEALQEVLEGEMTEFLGAEPGERTEARNGYRAGYYGRNLVTRIGKLELRVPRDRGGEFSTALFERYARSEKALVAALAEMYVQGVSTRKVTDILVKLLGPEVSISSTQVSRAAEQLDTGLAAWRERPLDDTPYLFLDARYERVREAGRLVDCAVLVATGITKDGHRRVLGVSVALSEAEIHWRAFLDGLIRRGLRGVKLIVSDAHAGLNAARRATLPSVPWQRCQFHLQQNAQAYVTRLDQRKPVAQRIRAIFNAPDRVEAERLMKQTIEFWAVDAPKLAQWAEENLPEGFAAFDVPLGQRVRLRTTNGLERINREIKRRTRVASIFPNTASCLRLVSALLAECDEDWMTGKIYLNLKD